MLVLKFGGSSVANAERVLAAAQIVAAHRAESQVIVVVSAMAGVTDALIRAAEQAMRGAAQWRDDLADIAERHQRAFLEIAGQVSTRFSAAWASVEAAAAALATGAIPPESAAAAREIGYFSGWGERLILDLFTHALSKTGISAVAFPHEPVVLAGNDGQPGALASDPSIPATRAWLLPQLAGVLSSSSVPILPGYIARTAGGQSTTLGRNGSDHSASIVAAALGAQALYIYSDVAGVYTADPRVASNAQLLPRLTYSDVAAITAAGARVLHPRTVEPLAYRGIPLYLRSAFAPKAPGTDILPQHEEHECLSC